MSLIVKKKIKILCLTMCLTAQNFLSAQINCADNPYWPMFGHDVTNTSHNAQEERINSRTVDHLIPLWQEPGPALAHPVTISSDDIVYYHDYSGALNARNAINGDLIWSTVISGAGEHLSQPLLVGQTLYIGAETTAFAIDRLTGAVIWDTVLTAQPEARITSSPSYAEGRVFFGYDTDEGGNPPPPGGYTERGAILALDAQTGNIIWTFVPSLGFGPGVGVRRSSPALDVEEGILYIGTGNATDYPAGPLSDALLALNYRTNDPNGELIWSYQFTQNDASSAKYPCNTSSDISATPNIFDIGTKKYVGVSDTNGVYAVFDRLIGKLIWKEKIIPKGINPAIVSNASATLAKVFPKDDCQVNAKIIIAGATYDPFNALPNDVLLLALQGDLNALQQAVRATTTGLRTQVTALDAGNGRILWKREFEGSTAGPFTSVNDIAFVFGYNGILQALNIYDGKTKWILENDPAVVFGVSLDHLPFGSAPTIYENKIYFGTGIQSVPGGIFSYYLPPDF